MKGCLVYAFAALSLAVSAENIRLPAVPTEGGKSVMHALKERKSIRTISGTELPREELSGVLWAANGFNRPDRRTNATGMNKQEIQLFVCMKSGAYRYDARANELIQVSPRDLRPAVAGHQDYVKKAPAVIVIAADTSDRIYAAPPWNTMTHYDAGIVSGNIYLYCSSRNLATVCRGTMDRDALKKALGLGPKTVLHLNHPVGYPE